MKDLWQKEEFSITTDKTKLQVERIYAYLSRSYWATGRSKEIVERSIQHSLCFGLFHINEQIGFARVITDYATFAYLCDVYVIEEYQGKGLGKWLMSVVMSHPDLQGLRRWSLATRDAHGLYRQYGFTALKSPEKWMEIFNPPKQS